MPTEISSITRFLRELPFTQRERILRTDRRWQQFAVVLCAALFFAVISPYNAVTYLEFPMRWAYWTLTVGCDWLICALVFSYQTPRHMATWTSVTASSIIATPAVFVIIYLIQSAIGYQVEESFIPTLLASIWVICFVLGWIYAFVNVGEVLPATDADTVATSPQPTLNTQLPEPFRDATIVALQADDHYVHVHTDQGSHLHYIRLRDAIALMEGVPGVRVHRSWWLRLSAVQGLRKFGSGWRVDGEHVSDVPVSRSGLAELKAAGAFDQTS